MRPILFASFIALLLTGCEKQNPYENREEIEGIETGEGLFGMKDGNASVGEVENSERSLATEIDRLLKEAGDLRDQGK